MAGTCCAVQQFADGSNAGAQTLTLALGNTGQPLQAVSMPGQVVGGGQVIKAVANMVTT